MERKTVKRNWSAAHLGVLTGLTILTSACGGGGGTVAGLVSTPPPPPPPAPPPPTPTPTPAAALLAPAQTASPTPPIATGTVPNFDNPGSGMTIFPLLQTAVGSDFGGDATTTNQGATLALDGATGRLALTVNNAAVNLNGQAVNQVAYPMKLADGRTLLAYAGIPDLDYTAYGGWAIYSPNFAFLGGGALLGGYETPASQIPLVGSASYAGKSTLLWSEYRDRCACLNTAIGQGDVALIADFSARSIAGSMTNFVLADEMGFNGPLNNIAFTASFAGLSNLFAGTTRVTSTPGGYFGLGAGATGDIAGRFFGPSAQEVGAVWTLSDGTRRVIGSFGAKTGN